MNQPLSHYFLYTGHNSYLTGNQLNSKSSTEPIVKALKSGVRVIELDLWPNSSGTEAEVRHGGSESYHQSKPFLNKLVLDFFFFLLISGR